LHGRHPAKLAEQAFDLGQEEDLCKEEVRRPILDDENSARISSITMRL
jgi:hypothetical protein